MLKTHESKVQDSVMIVTDRLNILDISPAEGAFMMRLVNTEGWLVNIGNRFSKELEIDSIKLNLYAYGEYSAG
jgi:hypothetical protein